MHIGLIGGIGPAATDFYYRSLISRAAAMEHALELTIAHADSPTLLANMATADHDAQCQIYDRLTRRLKAAGAECVVITSISGHFCIDQFQAGSDLPVIDLLSTLRSWLVNNQYRKVGLLGTQTVMETAMHGKLTDIEIVRPEDHDLSNVHNAYVDLALSGTPKPAHRDVFFAAGETMVASAGAQAVLLGGTDLNVAFAGFESPFETIDCAGIHIDAIASKI